jgi:hypothetical protein
MFVLVSERQAAAMFLAMKAAGLHFRDWIAWAESFGQHRAGNFGRCGRHLLATLLSRHSHVNP